MTKEAEVPYVECDNATFWPWADEAQTIQKPFSEFQKFMESIGFAVTAIIPPLVLPTAPGTVIAIGAWWLVKLRPYADGIPAAWEMLPAPAAVQLGIDRVGVKTQCIYDNEWVQSEAEQEGRFQIIAAPAP